MKHLVRIYTILFILVADFKLFAQEPGDDDGGGGLEGEDPVPINGQLIWLAIVGLAFAFYYYKKYRKVTTES